MFAAGLAVSLPYRYMGLGYQENLRNNGIEDAGYCIAMPKGTGNNTTAVQTTGVYGAYFINSELGDYDIVF